MAEHKKVEKVIIINLGLIIMTFVILEIVSYCILSLNDISNRKYHIIKRNPLTKEDCIDTSRRISLGKTNIPSILIFGCSFAYGYNVNDNENLSAKLNKYTNRTVYNYGYPDTGTQFMYYSINNFHSLKNIQKPDTIIYVYIEDHRRRLCRLLANENKVSELKYHLTKQGQLGLTNDWYYPIYISKTLQLISKANLGCFDLLFALIKESKKITDKLYPNSTFVILDFRENESSKMFTNEEIKKLNNIGIKVITSDDLINYQATKEELSDDNYHPNAITWDKTAKALIKELRLNN